MAKQIYLNSFTGEMGTLSVFEQVFDDKLEELVVLMNNNFLKERETYITKVSQESALICLKGSCNIKINHDQLYMLSNPSECLIVALGEVLEILSATHNCILVLLKKR